MSDELLVFLETRNPAKVALEWTRTRLADAVRESDPPPARIPEAVVMLEKKLVLAEELLTEHQRVEWRREAQKMGGAYMRQRGLRLAAERKVEELRGILAGDGKRPRNGEDRV